MFFIFSYTKSFFFYVVLGLKSSFSFFFVLITSRFLNWIIKLRVYFLPHSRPVETLTVQFPHVIYTTLCVRQKPIKSYIGIISKIRRVESL